MAQPWLAAHEGYYGPPLTPEQRLDLVGWLGRNGYDGYAYSPKDDAHHRERWREPYPAEDLAHFATLAIACRDAGIDLALMVSPGLDWRSGDPTEVDALAAKLQAFADVGATVLSINWDDVPGFGAVAGDEHGRAVTAAISMVDGEMQWIACPVDYATATPTTYLAAFAAALPADVDIGWTGPSVVTPDLTLAEVTSLEASLGHRVAFCENFPVNDLGMADVLHLGLYPSRADDLARVPRRVLVNFMHRVEASKPSLLAAARYWHEADTDREHVWTDVIAAFPGLAPLARASRSWVADPEPDPSLAAWSVAALDGDARLEQYLHAGCRDGLDPALASEIEPWLTQWDLEAAAMLAALDLLRAERSPSITAVWAAAACWDDARRGRPQVFGIRFALYPMTRRDGDRLVADRGAVVYGTNLTDRLWVATLDRLALVLE